jgi:hypothetical protein
MYPNRRLLWIDTRILAVGICIAGIMVGMVKERVVMRFRNEWKSNTTLLDHKAVIWHLFR